MWRKRRGHSIATPVTKTIKSSGGDYSSLNAWEAGEQADLVSADEIAIAECYAFEDTTEVTIAGWTVDSTRYIKIYTPTAERHPGYWSNSKYRIVPGGGPHQAIDVETSYTQIIGLQVESPDSSSDYKYGIQVSSTVTSVLIEKNIVHMCANSTGSNHGGIQATLSGVNGPTYIKNNLVYEFDNTDGFGMSTASATSDKAYVYNNTIVDCDDGLKTGYQDTVAKNNLVYSCPNAYSSEFASGSDYNSTDNNEDMEGGGANNRKSQTFTFVNAGAKDYHITTGDTGAHDHGVNLYADGNLAVTDDIDSEARPSSGSFDIGMDELAPTPTITVTAPNGGEDWAIGSEQDITWTSTGTPGNVKIELSRNNGSTWEPIIASTADDGTYAWTVTAAATVQGLVKISSVSTPAVNDQSDAVFTISTTTRQIPPGFDAIANLDYNVSVDDTNFNFHPVSASALASRKWCVAFFYKE